MEVQKSGMPCFSSRSLLLSTIVLNDMQPLYAHTYVGIAYCSDSFIISSV